jgi:hypothetical protein
MTSGAAGVVFYNNTILSETVAGSSANVHWRNNLLLGENAAPAIFSISTNTNYSSSDFNGFRPNPGAPAGFQWNSPPPSVMADYGAAAAPSAAGGAEGDGVNRSLQSRRFATLAEYASATLQDQHSVLLDYDAFVKVPRLDARDIQSVQRLYRAEDLDFRLRDRSRAIDKGTPLANVTDGFTGLAPDLGALERDVPAPHYGPRP